ncbi:RNA polymerase III subunit GL b [Synchiropus splendidus]|uniref:RNA polymerase III subunit GL b n=1 Tax=Synchiropus splendidus TaxID=270530 RepID=UPI00237DD408|nr:RNA polymerase III subunit GL b [Synchiropus splendidus]XP_053743009.1 RNA polymerase III subunit GL b [Synchiropus splendidus]
MAGHGGGRGRRMMSFSVEAVGINRGESLPPSIQQPTPLFPLMEHKPLPLTEGEEAEYLLALKQEFRGTTRSLPTFIHPAATKRDVERYSDKYHGSEQTDRLRDAIPDWTRFPREVRPYLRRLKRAAPTTKPTTKAAEPLLKKTRTKDKEDVLLQLETLEKKEEQQSDEDEADGNEEGKKQEEEGAEAEEEYDEEEFEEETDYIMSYFDNGEEFGAESDDNMDEAVY